MKEENVKSNTLVKILGSATLAGTIAIVALVWSIYSTRLEDVAMQQQLANQATQIAKQDIQIALNTEQNQLLSQQATLEVQRDVIEDQLRTPFPTNSAEFALTATAIASQSSQIEATTQAIAIQQQQIRATQTALAQSPPISTATLSICPLIVIEGSVGGLPIEQTKTWAKLSQQGTTREPRSANINHICSRDSDNRVQVWVGYWSGDPGYLDFRKTMTSEEALLLVRQNLQQPIIVVPWGE